MPADRSDTTIAPVRKTVIVQCEIHAAFRIYTEELASWWPLETHSVGQDSADTCGIEGRVGGRLYERLRDGEESVWGKVLRWNPPHVLEFTWHPGREPDSAQTVEVTFTATDEGTRVDLTHSGWESLGERALETRQNYDSGWDMVFVQRYGARCAAETAVDQAKG